MMSKQTRSTASSSSRKTQKWIVALIENDAVENKLNSKSMISSSSPSPKQSLSSTMHVVKLKDPSTGEPRDYVVTSDERPSSISPSSSSSHNTQEGDDDDDKSNGTTLNVIKVENTTMTIMEIQCLESNFSSFFVGRHVVGEDGNLYVMNRMDPLFWVVASQEVQVTKKRSWQPYHQIVGEGLFFSSKGQDGGTIGATDHNNQNLEQQMKPSQVIPLEQLKHVFQTLCNEQTDHITYYKFCQNLALKWLERKRRAVHQCLLKQKQHKEQQQRRHKLLADQENGVRKQNSQFGCAGGAHDVGSKSSTFYMPDDDDEEEVVVAQDQPTSVETGELLDNDTIRQLKLDSVDIISNYLTPDWTHEFINSLPEDVASVVPSVTSATVASKLQTPSASDSNAKPRPIPVSQESCLDENDDDDGGTKNNKVHQEEAAVVVKKPLPPPPPAPRSVAIKALDKVNKKGMKKLSSYFGVAASKAGGGGPPPSKKSKKL